MGIIIWLIFGALVGWIASLIMRTSADQGMIANIIIGVIGAFIGGSISQSLTGTGITAFTLQGFVFAILGAIILIFFIRLFTGRGAVSR